MEGPVNRLFEVVTEAVVVVAAAVAVVVEKENGRLDFESAFWNPSTIGWICRSLLLTFCREEVLSRPMKCRCIPPNGDIDDDDDDDDDDK
jgi:hypothetical protein